MGNRFDFRPSAYGKAQRAEQAFDTLLRQRYRMQACSGDAAPRQSYIQRFAASCPDQQRSGQLLAFVVQCALELLPWPGLMSSAGSPLFRRQFAAVSVVQRSRRFCRDTWFNLLQLDLIRRFAARRGLAREWHLLHAWYGPDTWVMTAAQAFESNQKAVGIEFCWNNPEKKRRLEASFFPYNSLSSEASFSLLNDLSKGGFVKHCQISQNLAIDFDRRFFRPFMNTLWSDHIHVQQH